MKKVITDEARAEIVKRFEEVVNNMTDLFNDAEALDLTLNFNVAKGTGRFDTWKATSSVHTKPVQLL
jgi:t-SNARE complex subunit (syntaxin)